MAGYIAFVVSLIVIQFIISYIFWKKESELYRKIPRYVLYLGLATYFIPSFITAIFSLDGWTALPYFLIALGLIAAAAFSLIIFGLMRYQVESKQQAK